MLKLSTHSTLNKLSNLPPSINFEGVRYDEYPTALFELIKDNGEIEIILKHFKQWR